MVIRDLIDLFLYKVHKDELIRYVGKQKSIVIPEKIKYILPHAFFKSPVTKIDINKVYTLHRYAFHNTRTLEEVILNNEIYTIPRGCFEACFSLHTVNIPSSVKKIENMAFSRCYDLKTVEIPNSVTKMQDEIFKESGITSIRIPSSVRDFGKGMFDECKELDSVILECYLEEFPACMFANCKSLTHLEFVEGVERLGDYALFHCENLKDFDLPYSVEKIGDFALTGTLLSYADLSNVNEIGRGAFSECENLEGVDLGDRITYIPEEAFASSSIFEVLIPRQVIEIGPNAFDDCEFLQAITFDNPDVKIHHSAFTNCPNIERIYYKKEEIDVSKVMLEYIDNEVLEYLYKHKEDFKKLKAPIGLNTLSALDEAGLLEDFLKNANFKYYKQILEEFSKHFRMGIKNIEALDRLTLFCYTLGVFDKNIGQKSSELIKLYTEKNYIRPNNINSLSYGMMFKSLDLEMIKGVTESKGAFFKDLMNNSGEFPKLIGLSLSRYQEVQSYNTSDNAKHRQLKPTAKKFMEYFSVDKFENIEDENDYELASEIGKFYSLQYVYDKAKVVMGRFARSGIGKSMISEERRKEDMPELEEAKEKVRAQLDELDTILTDIYYEFLLKNDPRNLTSGRYCNDCCGHIEGMGEDIAFGSILNPSTQTLVIKDKTDRIISKAVFYVNSDNEIIINGVYYNEDAVFAIENKLIKKYLEAFEIFIEDYNEHHEGKIERVYLSAKSPLMETFNYLGEKSAPVNVVDYGEYQMDKEAIYSGDCDIGVMCIIDKGENKTSKSRKKS